jgi:hypothetical protein
VFDNEIEFDQCQSEIGMRKKWINRYAFHLLLDLYRHYILAALVTVGCIAWDWSVAVWTCLEFEIFRSDVLVHHLRKLSITQESSSWLTGEGRERVVSYDRRLCEHTRSSHFNHLHTVKRA